MLSCQKCNSACDLEKKNKEIRDKLRVLNRLLKSIKSDGLDELTKEWFRQVIGVVYELACASLCYQNDKGISFERGHDFVIENSPAEASHLLIANTENFSHT